MLCVLKAVNKQNSNEDFHILYENEQQATDAFDRLVERLYTHKYDTVVVAENTVTADGPEHIYKTILIIYK